MKNKKNRSNPLSFQSVFKRAYSALEVKKVKKGPLAGIDIEKEYALIKNKKSNLSYSVRELVKAKYKELYKEVI